MIHLGDITKISGYDAPIVDCVIGGSPCQDLSVAGKRAGLAGERSGLYMEQIRIIKEMREHDRLSGRTGVAIRPRYMVWENVPGAFSSNGGKDFAAVLEEAIRIAEPEAPDVPVPPKGWPTSGCIRGLDGRWSIAWRVLDAQFWGVPQRRRRIALVADFGGDSASEILFVREGVRGYLEESEPQRKEAAGNAGASVGVHNPDRAAGCDIYNLAVTGDTVCSLTAQGYGSTGTCPKVIAPDKVYGIDHVITTGGNCTAQGACVYEDVQATLKAAGPHAVAYTLKIRGGCEGGGKGALIQTDKSATLSTLQDQTPFQPVAYSIENHPADSRVSIDESGKVQTLTSRMGTGGGNVPMIMEPQKVYCLQGNGIDRADTAGCNGKGWNDKTCYTLNTIDRPAVAYSFDSLASNSMKSKNPYSGCRAVEVAKTLDTTDPNPSKNQGGMAIVQPVAYGVETFHCNNEEEKVPTLKARDWKDPNVVAYRQGGFADYIEGEIGTLRASGGDLGGGTESLVVNAGTRYIVRRLTPLECERLQGFPDGWTDIGEWIDSKGKKHKDADSPRYKALGNSIAIPPWKWVLKRICACYERDATMASLFDGIGGFPYIWEQLNGKGSCLWASEIEEFPMAVTKLRFGGAE